MDIAVQIALNAAIAGAIYALAALGFNLIYGVSRFFDLGYGALMAVGGYTVFYVYRTLELSLVSSIGIGMLVAGVCGLLIERVIYRPLRARKASNAVLLVASLGVLTVVQAVLAIIFSSQFQTLSRDFGNQRIFEIAGGVMTETQVLILIAGILIMIGLGLFLRYTLFGKAVRAVADDEEVAKVVGIDTGKIFAAVFFVGSAIGGLAGIAVGFDTGIEPTMGMSLLLKGVIAAILGGIGNVYGGVLGAFLLAAIENIGAWQFSGEWKDAIAFSLLILFLLFRPKGILGRP